MINLSDDLSVEENTLILIDLTTRKVKKIFWALIWALKKEKPTTGVGFKGVSVHLTDQLSNFRIIPDYLKVVDFIEKEL